MPPQTPVPIPQGAQLVPLDQSQGGSVPIPAGATLQPLNQDTQQPTFWQKIKSALAPQSVPGAGLPSSLQDFGERLRQPGDMPGSTEGPGLMRGLSEWDKASGGEIAGGVGDIGQGNIARGGHRIVQGVGAGSVPLLPFLAPLVASNPALVGRVAAGGMGGKVIAEKGAEAFGASPDQQDLAGDIGGLAGGYGGAKLPSLLSKLSSGALRTSAGQAFNAVSDVAGSSPVSAEGAGQAALSAKDLQDVGRTMPRVMTRFLQRVTAPNAEPLSYDEARRFYSAAGELSANEQAAYTPAMKRSLNQFRNQLGSAIQQTADNAGVGTEYGQAMSDYAKSKRLEDTWETIWGATKKNLIPPLIKGLGIGAGGTAAYGAYRSLTK